jgi:hypothetical protein
MQAGVPNSLPGMPAQPPNLPGMTAQTAFQAGYTQPTMPVNAVNLQRPQDAQMTQAGTGVRIPAGYSDKQPPLPSSLVQYFIKPAITGQQAIAQWEQQTHFRATQLAGMFIAYQPVMLAQTVVRYQDKKAGVYTARNYAFHVPDVQRAGMVQWQAYQANAVDMRAVDGNPQLPAFFGDMAPGLSDPKRLAALKAELVDMLYNTAALVIPFNPTLKVFGSPDADFSVYQAAVQQRAREERDAEIDAITKKYGAQAAKLEEMIRKKEIEIRAEKKELQDRKREEMFTTGEAFLSLLKGRTTYTLSRVSQASRYRRQTDEDLKESGETIKEAENQLQGLEAEFQQVLQAANEQWARVAAQAEEYRISALKKDIQTEMFGVGWIPTWYAEINGQQVFLPAFTG